MNNKIYLGNNLLFLLILFGGNEWLAEKSKCKCDIVEKLAQVFSLSNVKYILYQCFKCSKYIHRYIMISYIHKRKNIWSTAYILNFIFTRIFLLKNIQRIEIYNLNISATFHWLPAMLDGMWPELALGWPDENLKSHTTQKLNYWFLQRTSWLTVVISTLPKRKGPCRYFRLWQNWLILFRLCLIRRGPPKMKQMQFP